jgi:hypothetical protein
VHAHELREHLDDAAGSDPARDVDRQALAGEFIDHRQALQALVIGAVIERAGELDRREAGG